MILSVHDSDMVQERQERKYLQRTAGILRASIKPPLHPGHNLIDKQIRLLLDGTGPCFRHKAAVESMVNARRVGNLWYTRSFGEKIFAEMLLQHAKARGKGNQCAVILLPC